MTTNERHTMTTVDGWPVLSPNSPLLFPWDIPGTGRHLTLHNGSPGFLLAHYALWWHEKVEPLDAPAERRGGVDDGGYAERAITGGSTPTKHQTGLAEDLNWHQHPYDTPVTRTFTHAQIEAIRNRLDKVYEDVLEWGGNWPSHPGSTAHTDGMHTQVAYAARMPDCERVARKLLNSPRGKRLLEANPSQRAVILS